MPSRKPAGHAKNVVGALLSGLPARAVITDGVGVMPFATRFGGQPQPGLVAVTLPETVDEVAHVLATADAFGLDVEVRGGGSRLASSAQSNSVGSQPAARNRIVLSAGKLVRVYAIDPLSRCVHADAGITLGQLNRRLAGHGLCAPGEMVPMSAITLGGAVAMAASGAVSLGPSPFASAVTKCTIVQPGGRVLRLGEGALDAPNLDLASAMLSLLEQGCALVDVTLRVEPSPSARADIVATWPGWQEAICGVLSAGFMRDGWAAATLAAPALLPAGEGANGRGRRQTGAANARGVVAVIALAAASEDLPDLAAASAARLRKEGAGEVCVPADLEPQAPSGPMRSAAYPALYESGSARGAISKRPGHRIAWESEAIADAFYLDVAPGGGDVILDFSLPPAQLVAAYQALSGFLDTAPVAWQSMIRPLDGLILIKLRRAARPASVRATVKAGADDLGLVAAELESVLAEFGGIAGVLHGPARLPAAGAAAQEIGDVISQAFAEALLQAGAGAPRVQAAAASQTAAVASAADEGV